MMYVRGHEQDFDSWAEQTKSDIWSSKNVLKYFKRSEDYHGNYPGPAHATGNELYIGKYSYESPIQKCLFDAFKEKGISTGDVNVLPSRVFGYPDVAIKNGGRWCSYQAFIKPILQRNKLIISTFSDVVKIHLSEELNKRAIGVTYRKHGTHYFVFAKKEIIISAGVIDSPKLLLLSGIGPKDHLTSLQIKPLLDLPVGETYVAQSYIPLKFQINDSLSIIPNRNLTDKTFIEYYAKRKGPLTSFNARFGIGFTQRKNSQDPNFPDIYYVFNGIGGDSSGHELFSKDSELKPGIYEKYFKSFADKDGFIVEIACVKVKSSGNIRLATKNPNDQPLINPNYFSNPTDMACSIDGIEYIVDFIESSKVMQKINAHVPTVAFPGCETLKFKSRAYWDCYIRQLTGSPDASTSSCRMGDGSKSSKTTAVIDPEFRVLGVQGLRVIDASSMPWITTGNPMATVIMMGEIGSQLILDRWEKRAKLETRISSHSIVQLQINSQVDNRNTLS